MNNKDFAHLHIHNEYSMLDGYGTAKQWARRAKQLGFNAIGLTNHGNVDGCLSWMRACDKEGISPVCGAELYVTPDVSKRGKRMAKGHMTVLCKNGRGWRQLCALLTKANLEGSYGGRPYVDYEMILNCDLFGWEIMTGCIGSFLNLPGSDVFFKELFKRRPRNIWFEIMPANHSKQIEYHLKWAEKDFLNLPLVATVDCHYLLPEHNKVQDVLIAIQRNYKWDDPKRWSLDFRDLYLMTADEIYDGFMKQNVFNGGEIITAMENSLRIADRCKDFRIKEVPVSLPNPPKDYNFGNLIYNGLIDLNLIGEKEYEERVNQEYEVIQKKNFQDYYLIVKDVIDFCKKENIKVGPGRGSVGGSLIAYLLGITQIDPIKYDLSFARFISEDRNDLPDIDLDFEMNKRHLVYEYLERTYKKGCAVLSTYPRIKTRGAIRDIGRVFELPESDISAFANLFDYNDHDEDKFKKITETEVTAIDFKKTYPEAFNLVSAIIGQIRAVGQHPAAVILSNKDLTDGSTCVIKKTSDKRPVVNWVMNEVEHFGLIKLDVLGLSTLSVIDYAEELINARENNNKRNIRDNGNSRCSGILGCINFDDDKVFNLINEGKTAGIFQIAAYSTTKLCVEMGIDCFEDWIAAIALVRPGPTDSGMTRDYIERKHGKRWDKTHTIYESITKDTYGVMVYQEQIMQAISKLAGMSESQADNIRKIVGKKRDKKEFEPYRRKFLAGCIEQKTMSLDEAKYFWHGLMKWANYGFNRAHSVEYAIIGYWTAWLKAYYPMEFYCGALTYGAEKKQPLIDEIIDANIKIVAPKVKTSNACKWTFNDNELYIPFNELKGIGDTTAEECCHVTKRKTRKDLFGKNINNGKSKMEELLDNIKACDDDKCEYDILNQYLDFNINE